MANQRYGSSRWGDLTELSALREDLLRHLPDWIVRDLEDYQFITMGIRHKGNQHRDAGYGRYAPTEFNMVVDIFSLDEMQDRANAFAALRHVNPNQLLVRLKY